MIRPLVYYGNKVLRERCKEIEEITPEIKQLANDLMETMTDIRGAGLAAPQVGVPLRIFASCYHGDDENGAPVIGDPYVVINPKISIIGDETWVASDNCLSVPTIDIELERPWEVEVEYTTLEGNRIKERCIGWKARCMLHENDHLNGVLNVDRLSKEERRRWEPKLRLLKKKYS